MTEAWYSWKSRQKMDSRRKSRLLGLAWESQATIQRESLAIWVWIKMHQSPQAVPHLTEVSKATSMLSAESVSSTRVSASQGSVVK